MPFANIGVSRDVTLGEDAYARQRPQQPIQGIGVRGGGAGQFCDRFRAVFEVVGDPELRRSVDRLRNPVAGYHLVKLLVR